MTVCNRIYQQPPKRVAVEPEYTVVNMYQLEFHFKQNFLTKGF